MRHIINFNLKHSYVLALCSALLAVQNVYAEIYDFNLSKKFQEIESSDLILGSNKSPNGNVLGLTTKYFTENGKPWFPVMGEIHYVRVPEKDWEDEIIKMKLSGIDIVATYVFWIYHEEKQGEYDWGGIRSLSRFADLCTKHDMKLFLRIGPWCHGEVRNGALPDWILKLEGGYRKNNPQYLDYVRVFFREINKQSEKNYYKNGGTIIGAQIENEYRFNNAAGLAHLLKLKEIAREESIDVPYYTATGWPGSDPKQKDLLCVWGAYPEAPWSKSIKPLALSANYLFGELENDKNIGIDLVSEHDEVKSDLVRYPYATAEMGGGNQITYHRRPIIESDDVTSLAYVKVGSGANLMGYYMYHGGSNQIGKYSTLQESRATKYPNDYPIISYDFFSPIGEWGDLRESYHQFKKYHLFLNDFGDVLAPTNPCFPTQHNNDVNDIDVLRMSARADKESGFIFISNYQRSLQMKDHNDIKFNVKTSKGNISFPEKGMNIKANEQRIVPFNLDLKGVNLNYSTAQPMCILKGQIPTYVFFASYGSTEMSFDASQIKSFILNDKRQKQKQGIYNITLTSTSDHKIDITSKSGNRFSVIILTEENALNSWKLEDKEQDILCLFNGELIRNGEDIKLRKLGENRFNISIFPATKRLNIIYSDFKENRRGIFRTYDIDLNAVYPEVKCTNYKKAYEFKYLYSKLPEDERLNEVSEQCPGPQYCVNFDVNDNSSYWLIETTGIIKDEISDIKLTVDYLGDTGSLYKNGELVADNYYCGIPFNINLDRFDYKKNNKFLFQVITPPENHKIYLENNAVERLKESNNIVKSVKVTPKYELKVKITR